jgi:flagellar biosynthesis protein FlhA
VGGDLLVGLVIFLILVIIQFVVITKGSNRISEVAARFTLDGMPGKQMAIDADLNAGMITEEQARSRRETITAEAEFYGAMDGAGKFVRGDSVAGLIITVVNIVGGVMVGMSNDLPVMDALRKYAVLTVGDGLVTQIPALIIAVAAGVLVTKTRSETPLAQEIAGQFLLSPSAMRLSGLMVVAFGLVPGLPTLPFVAMGGLALVASVWGTRLAARNVKDEEAAATQDVTDEHSRDLTQEGLKELLKVDRMGIEIGYRLIPMVEAPGSGNLLDHIAMVRKQFAQQYGLVVPPIRMRDNLALEPNAYRILLGGQEIGRGDLYPDSALAMNPGGADEEIAGIPTKDPTFGLDAIWIPAGKKSEAEILGYTVVDPPSVLVTHLTEIVKTHAHELLSRDDVQAALDRMKETQPTVVAELTSDILPVGIIQKVLSNLLRERIPIRNLSSILEALADHARETKDAHQLTELVRARLGRTIVKTHGNSEGRILALTLDPAVEQEALQLLVVAPEQSTHQGAQLLRRIQDAALGAWSSAQVRGQDAVILVRAPLRRHLAELFRNLKPPIPVLAYGEVLEARGVDSVGVIRLEPQKPVLAAAQR